MGPAQMTDEAHSDQKPLKSVAANDPVVDLEYGRVRSRRKWIKWLLVGSGVVVIGVLGYSATQVASQIEAGYCQKCFRVETRQSWYFGPRRLWFFAVVPSNRGRAKWNLERDRQQKRPCSHMISWALDTPAVDVTAQQHWEIHNIDVMAHEVEVMEQERQHALREDLAQIKADRDKWRADNKDERKRD